MSEYLMGIDNGGTLCKAVIFDLEGNEIASHKASMKLLTPKEGFTERDMDELWQANCLVISSAIEKAKISPKEIIGVSCTGHGKGLYILGDNDKIIYNGIVSTDARAVGYQKMWVSDKTADRVYKKTVQSVLACQPVCLLRWLKDNEPKVYAEIKYIFSVKDFIRYKLTGNAYNEITDMSGTNMLNIVDECYDKDLLKDFGIEEMYEKLSPLRYPWDNCGVINEKSSNETSLAIGTTVSGGMFDIDACAVAMNVVDDTNICVIAGTWSINEYVSKAPVDNQSVMMNSLFCLPNNYLIEECSPTSAGNNEWFLKTFFQGSEDTSIDYEKMNAMVESIKPDGQNIVFLPYLFGSNYNPEARASFIGLTSRHSLAEIARSVYEGIVFCHKVHIDKLLANRKAPKAIRLAGGVVNSPIWVQIFADILGYPIETIHGDELGALGAAMSAAVAADKYTSLENAAKDMVKVKDTFYPNKENEQIYHKKYNLYKKVSASLDHIWEEF